ncbi:cellulase family glycosylhydrolase [Pseudochryseolinea flava]|uniref:Glycosyl hydrolase family 5 n=1 Tax=Pseudochryseolinea flava TaxID=2059302 RepID=A0A364XZ66_9BACT|nr:cellulase family glycosylhydrolase [Pseudochryseolinea flava]RAV98731.1 glycosyl hydrolase family 5 [Pseudochryseolinea flava]
MKNSRSIILSVVMLLCAVYTAQGQGFLKANGKIIVNEKGEKVILRGMGLGGWMLQEGYMLRVHGIGQQQHVIRGKLEELVGKEKTDAFYSAWLANHCRKIDIDSMKAWGFNSVRLPMHFNLYTPPVDQEPVPGQQTWLEKGFAMTDSLLAWCKANQMYLILDLHAAPGGQGNDVNISDRDPSKPSLWDSEANLQKTIALWRKLAERYANEPWIGAYDIINEPNWGFVSLDDKNGCAEDKNEPLRKLMMDITAAIREVDKKHIVIIEGNCWGNNYRGVLPPWDNNMVLSFHKYWNYTDQQSIQGMLDLRNQHNLPLWLGETGENSNVWFTSTIRLVERNDIGWAWWPLKKMGFNNPMEIKVAAGYQKILDYWAGRGEKPAAEEAWAGLKEQAENLKLENCIYHSDVVDAMFRQTRENTSLPFTKQIVTSKATIPAVNYDLGRIGVAYHDLDSGNYYISTGKERTPWNKGHVYRNDAVDITNKNGNFFIDNFEKGEWLKYTLHIAKKGKYTVKLLVASEEAGGKISAALNAAKTTLDVPASGSAESFKEVVIPNVTLNKGANILIVEALVGGFTFKEIQISSGK